MTQAEHNNALHKGRPCFRSDGLIAVYRKAHLAAGLQGIGFVAGGEPVEPDLLGIPVIEAVHRDGIRTAVISVYGQNAPPAGLQKRFCGRDTGFVILFRISLNMQAHFRLHWNMVRAFVPAASYL